MYRLQTQSAESQNEGTVETTPSYIQAVLKELKNLQQTIQNQAIENAKQKEDTKKELSDLKMEIKEMKKIVETTSAENEKHKQVITRMTEEVVYLRNVCQDLKKNYLEHIWINIENNILPSLPFENLEDLQNFEKKLMENEEMRKQLVSVSNLQIKIND